MDTGHSNSSGSSNQMDEMMSMMNMQSPAYYDDKNNFVDFPTPDYSGAMYNVPNFTAPYPSPVKTSLNNVPIPLQFPEEELSGPSDKKNSTAAMREMIFRIAVMQPIHIDPEEVKPPKRRNVKISKDPQSVAARHRRERISERIRILQRLVPGGTKMDTASMLDEAIHYVKFLKKQVRLLENPATLNHNGISCSSSNNGGTDVGGDRSICIGYPTMCDDMGGFIGKLRNDDV